jgi:hypothetical protein
MRRKEDSMAPLVLLAKKQASNGSIPDKMVEVLNRPSV